MSSLYDALTTLCKRSGGTWKGDIHVLRHLIKSVRLTNVGVTQHLEALKHRGLLTYHADRRSPKHVIWTVTVTKPEDLYIDAYFDASGFIEAVDQVRRKRDITITAMCEQLSIDSRTLHRIRTGAHEQLRTDTMAALVVWSGIDPKLYIKRRT